MTDTQLVSVDGRPVLRFSRQVAFPIEQVWPAVSEAERIRKWFLPRGPWTEVRELGALLGQVERPPIIDRDEPYTVHWADDNAHYDFRLDQHGTDTIVELSVPIDADEVDEAPIAAPTIDSFLDRLPPYLAGEDLTYVAFADLDEVERRVHSYAERFGVDPGRGRESVAHTRAAVEGAADVEPVHFEPSPEAAEALEESMTAYVREHKDALDAAEARRGDDGDASLTTAFDDWIVPSAQSVEEIGDRLFLVFDRFIRDESIAIPDLESDWQSSRSGDPSAE